MDMRRAAFTITADGSYAARLALDGGTGGWFPERWTLDGPEPYAVPLPGGQPEEPDSEVLPLTDGRVLIRRRVAERHTLALLYPTGPGTGELPLGSVECPRLSLLPPAPGGGSAYGLVHGERSTELWLLYGGRFGPQRVADVPGQCSGGAWLDRTGRLLALDRELAGRTKTVVADLERGGEISPLLQITEESNDRLLLADPYSGLLLVRSDAPGGDRLGWGVLGSTRPVRFPECLHLPQVVLTPFAAQPGQELAPEGCAVAFRIEGPSGSWVGVWRASARQLQQFPGPAGWLVGTGLWTPAGELRLPYVTPYVRCGLARLRLPVAGAEDGAREGAGSDGGSRRTARAGQTEQTGQATGSGQAGRDGRTGQDGRGGPGGGSGEGGGGQGVHLAGVREAGVREAAAPDAGAGPGAPPAPAGDPVRSGPPPGPPQGPVAGPPPPRHPESGTAGTPAAGPPMAAPVTSTGATAPAPVTPVTPATPVLPLATPPLADRPAAPSVPTPAAAPSGPLTPATPLAPLSSVTSAPVAPSVESLEPPVTAGVWTAVPPTAFPGGPAPMPGAWSVAARSAQGPPREPFLTHGPDSSQPHRPVPLQQAPLQQGPLGQGLLRQGPPGRRTHP
ncbi:hypothetical protein [Streptomyces eurocidicus]|uniref:Uncharacterized protein n=1 Tax=Streptomyces eurocidicus TaxID=66423 RepID=A0A7W8BGN5_STREU|nr:hypothetical protein [Streptomyces eurocidicus]MBB5121109.1 hypothetical protein [Streptomyces eurocidicus]